ncbi:MAG: UDP-glucose 4-epimerase GalE [Clostridia bacterium]|nr:UDP-glucose 4-epimerase GalE [Clostridia bacterium]MDD4375991.1 UDP-glucose 4-epimerase GalE [Clostridia bacterium]
MAILVTGGAGYIGSHTCVELLERGEEVVVLDNFSNSKPEVIENIMKITGKQFKVYNGDILNKEDVLKVFSENDINEVIHFAGLKAVGESMENPLKYYQNNVVGSLILVEVMQQHGCNKIVFSSSATVYGAPEKVPVSEEFPLDPENVYGRTKYMVERILEDLAMADKNFSVALLRYFNPVGAHKSGLIGEDPEGTPNNLMPYIVGVASEKFECLRVFGDDYETRDGTGVRDYLHVVDLADAHLKALDKIRGENGTKIYNLGTGKSVSVLELIKAFEKSNNIKINYVVTSRRPGDIAECWASPKKAKEELGWSADKTVDEMCRDSWNYAKRKIGDK